jgi:hypothetical protein
VTIAAKLAAKLATTIDRRWALIGGLALAGCADDGGPWLAGATPPAAARDAMVTLTGSRLCGARGDCVTAAGEVQLGLDLPMVRATVVSYSDTTAQIVIPSITPVGPTTLLVTVNDRTSNALAFEVLAEAAP